MKKRKQNVVNFRFCFFGTKVLRHCRCCCAACQVCLVVCSAAAAAAASLAVAYLEALWHCQLRCGIAFKLIVLHISVATLFPQVFHMLLKQPLCCCCCFLLASQLCCFSCLSHSQNTSTLRASLFPVAFL